MLTDWRNKFEEIEVGTGRKLKDGDTMAVMSVGPIGNNVAKAIENVEKECDGITVAHYDMRFIKPLDEKLLTEAASKFKYIITVEDGVRKGGFGSAVLEWLSDNNYTTHVTRLGLPDKFVEQGTVSELQHITGIDTDSIAATIKSIAGSIS